MRHFLGAVTLVTLGDLFCCSRRLLSSPAAQLRVDIGLRCASALEGYVRLLQRDST